MEEVLQAILSVQDQKPSLVHRRIHRFYLGFDISYRPIHHASKHVNAIKRRRHNAPHLSVPDR